MTWKPHVTVAAVIERGQRFLLVEELVNGRRLLNQPAGHLEDDERLVDAVAREALEETGWRFSPSAVTGIYRWRPDGSGSTYLRVAFCGECDTQAVRSDLDNGIVRTRWMTRDELRTATIGLRSPMVIQCIDDYLSGYRYPLHLLTDID